MCQQNSNRRRPQRVNESQQGPLFHCLGGFLDVHGLATTNVNYTTPTTPTYY